MKTNHFKYGKVLLLIIFILLLIPALTSCKETETERDTSLPRAGVYAGITHTDPNGDMGEWGSETSFTIKLNSPPTATVTIGVSSSDTNEATISPASLSFTGDNWNVAQTITATGVNDGTADADQTISVGFAVSSEDSDYNDLTLANISIINMDYERGLILSDVSGDMGEWGSEATFTLKLKSQPTADVTFGISSSDTTEATVSPTSLLFTTENWDAAQTITATGVNDGTTDADQSLNVVFSLSDTDSEYNGQTLGSKSITNLSFSGVLSDTGQTEDHTNTIGEDSDYTINSPSFTVDSANDVVTDNISGLIWQRQQDDGNQWTWSTAGTYCAGLTQGGSSDWRLPTRRELMSIVSYGTYNPSINSTVFPGTQSSVYWSSTVYAFNTSYAWFVIFYNGFVYSNNQSNSYYVRCVRD